MMLRVLSAFLPDKYREEIVGDLVEQSLAPAKMRKELALSVIHLFPIHIRQSKEDPMKHAKLIASAAVLVMSLLQAFDSRILDAPVWIGLMVYAAVIIGIAGLFIANNAVRLAVASLVFVLLVTARIASPVSLPQLMLVGLPIFLILLLGPRFMGLGKEKNQSSGPGSPA